VLALSLAVVVPGRDIGDFSARRSVGLTWKAGTCWRLVVAF